MIQLKNTTDKQTFHIPRTVMKTNFTSGNEVKDVSITQNGTYQIVPSDGKKALNAVKVDVDIKVDTAPYFNEGYAAGVADQKEKLESIAITKNGTYNKEDGYNQIDVDVTPVLQNKEVTYITNGEYSVTPDEGYDGLDELKVKVDVDVSNAPFRVPVTLKFGKSTIERFPDNWDWSAFENVWVCSNLFSGCSYLKEVPKLRLNKVTELNETFLDCRNVKEIDASEWNPENLSQMYRTFYNTGLVENPQLDTSNVYRFDGTFESCSNLKRIKNFNTSKATNIDKLFAYCYYLESVDELDASSINSSIYSYSSPFYFCYMVRHFGGLKGMKHSLYLDSSYSFSYESLQNIINGLADGVSSQTLYLHQDLVNQLSDEDIAIATNKGWSISPAKSITSPIVIKSMSDFPRASYHITFKNYDFSQYTGSWSSGASSALPSYSALCVFEGDISSTTNASQMFRGCSRLGYLKLYNTGNITTTNSMLAGCTNLVEANFKDWDVSNVTTMTYMFNSVADLDLDFSNWNVSNVTDFEYMFYQCKIKNVDMSNWKHSPNARMKNMFSNSEVENVIFGDISNVYNMDSAFVGCKNLKSVTMTYPLTKLLSNYTMFHSVNTEGTFYYNPEYDYSMIIEQLPDTWKAVPLS